MLTVVAEDFIRVDAIDLVLPLYRELVELTRAEPLCLRYDFFADPDNPGHFIFFEQWPNRAALDAHCETEHFLRLVPQIDAYQRAENTFQLLDELWPENSPHNA